MMSHQCILIQRMKRQSRRGSSINDHLLKTIFSQSRSMSEMEQEYMSAAESGNLERVQEALNEYNININCLDHLGRSALELALIGDHIPVVEYLLPRSNLQCVEDALLYAISKDKVKLAELILDHPLYKSNRVQLANSDSFYQQDSGSPRLRPNITPLVLAAHRDNFQIIQLLLDRGGVINPPHDYFCDCIECSNMRIFDSVKYSRSRLNTYQALASPAYISLSSDDPIHTTFELSHQLEQLADVEKEYKSEYRNLAEKCKNYGVELLDLCRTSDEIMAVLDEEGNGLPPVGETHSLARVKLALKYEQKRFIAHPTCQRQLISLWYSGVPWMRHQKMIVKLLSVPIATLLLPISSLIFILAPYAKLTQRLKSPFVKFLNHTCSYMVFLVLVLLNTLRGGSGNTWLDMACSSISHMLPHSCVSILILVWVAGMFLHECRQLWREGPRNYLGDWWNWMDSSLILLYVASFTLQVVVYIKVIQADAATKAVLCPTNVDMSCRRMKCIVTNVERNWTSCTGYGDCERIDDLYGKQSAGEQQDMMSDMNQLSDIFFALASVLSFARIAHLLPANEQLGPLLVSFGRMLHDVVRFGVVFGLVFLAFMTGLTTLYRVHTCENRHFSRLDLSLSSLFWATFGMGDTKATLIDNRYLGSHQGLVSSHTKHNPLVVLMGYGLFWSYIAGAVVVLLNMLIAMMSNSFQEIYDDRDVEWKFARAKLWIDFFENGCTLPMPFNLIPNPKYLWKLIKFIRRKAMKDRDEPPMQLAYIYNRRKNGLTHESLEDTELPKKPDTFYKQVTRRLVQRYIYQKQNDLAELSQSECEFLDLKHDVHMLNNEVSKLHMELTSIGAAIDQHVKPKNGFSRSKTTTAAHRHARTNGHVIANHNHLEVTIENTNEENEDCS